jgi:hypothetical protein
MTRLASYDALAVAAFDLRVSPALKAAVSGASVDESVLLRVLQCIGMCLVSRVA